MTPGVRVHVVMPPSLVEGVDAARAEGQSRGDWVRRAVERALSEPEGPTKQEQADPGPVPSPEGVRSAAPAEQPVKEWSTDAEHAEVYLSEAQLRERHGVEAVVPSDPKVGDEVPLRRVSAFGPVPPRVPFRRDVKPFQRGDK